MTFGYYLFKVFLMSFQHSKNLYTGLLHVFPCILDAAFYFFHFLCFTKLPKTFISYFIGHSKFSMSFLKELFILIILLLKWKYLFILFTYLGYRKKKERVHACWLLPKCLQQLELSAGALSSIHVFHIGGRDLLSWVIITAFQGLP